MNRATTIRRALLAAAAVLALGASGCGGEDDPMPAATDPGTNAQGSSGRPIGAAQGAEGEAVAAALRFTRGYLRFQRGELEASEVPRSTPELRRGLRRLRIPPAARRRRARVVRARVDRIDPRSARVTVTVTNEDEQLTYPLPLDLVRRVGAWQVLSAGDDL